MTRARKSETLAGTVRQAIRDSGETMYRVALDSGVNYTTLHRFMTGKRAISLEALEKLCAYLGMRLTQ